jgi:hypothetical protein
MRFFVLTATYELRVSRKSHLRDQPKAEAPIGYQWSLLSMMTIFAGLLCTMYAL